MIKKLTIKGLLLLLACVSVTSASADTFKSSLSKNLNEATEWQVQLPQALEAHERGAVFVDFARWLLMNKAMCLELSICH